MLCSKDFFNKSKYNPETKEALWLSVIQDTHDSICSCDHGYAHLLALIFPLGHRDRNKTINDILLRDYKEKCLSGGAGDAASGFPKPDTDAEIPTEGAAGPSEEDAAFVDVLAAVEGGEGAR